MVKSMEDQDTLSGYGKTWPLHREHVNGIDVLRLSPEDEAEHNRLQDKAAFDQMREMKRLGTLPKELQDYFQL